jgi:hypothetical protein
MKQDMWITAGVAAKILEDRFGRPVRVDYVTKLGRLKRLRTQHIGSRIVLYNRNDVEHVDIKFRKPKPETTPEPSMNNQQLPDAA